MGAGKHRNVRDHLFGMAAVDLKLLTAPQVGELFMLQLMSDPPPPVAHIAVEHGYLTRDAVDQILAQQHKLLRRFGSEASLFGQVAVVLGLMSREQVALCLAKQRESGFRRKFGELCVEQGYLALEQVQLVLDQQEQVKRHMAAEVPVFGRIAVELGLLTREQLELCVEQQRAEGSMRRLGEICVERGFLHPAEIKRILDRQKAMQQHVDSLPPAGPAHPRAPEPPSALPSAPAALPSAPAALPSAPAALPSAPAALPSALAALPRAPAALPSALAALPRAPAALPSTSRGAPPAAGSQPGAYATPARQHRDRGGAITAPATVRGVGPALDRHGANDMRAPQHGSTPRPMAGPPDHETGRAAEPPGRALASDASASAVARLAELVGELGPLGASDVWLEPDRPIHVRINGEVQATPRTAPTPSELQHLLHAALPDAALRKLELLGHASCTVPLPGGGMVRCSVYTDRRGTGVALRLLPDDVPAPDELGLPPALSEVCWLPEGLVVVAGPSGSGRSTTVASLVNVVRQRRPARIVSIGDGAESRHDDSGSPISRRSVGEHAPTAADAIRSAMSEAADVITVEDVDESDLLLQCLRAGEAGHLVFATLRARSARLAIETMVALGAQSLGPDFARSLVASTLRGVFVQQLCRGSSAGRTAACEILFGTPEMAALVREGRFAEMSSYASASRELGMQTLNDHLCDLVQQGRVAPGEAYLRSNDRFELGPRLEALGVNAESPNGA